METTHKTGSGSGHALFLIEQLIVIAVFAVCAAVCVKIFTESFIIADTSADMNNAVLAAESGAECFKAVPGDIAASAELLGGAVDGGDAVVYYDGDWRVSGEPDALYILRLSPTQGRGDDSGLIFCDVSVERRGDGAAAGVIVEFEVAARR